MLQILFYGSIVFILYAYFIYPLSLMMIGCFIKNKIKKEIFTPYVTMIITGYNEEKRIRKKLENTFSLKYPKEKLEVIVASDGSTDKTNEIVKEYEKNGIVLHALPVRKGKEYAQKEAIQRAKGVVLVFSDVATILDIDGLDHIVSNFADDSIGCVSSEDRLISNDGSLCGEGFYVRYEMWLRRLESKVNTLVGLSGSFFAARKEVCQDFSEVNQSDFRVLLNSVKLGLRGINDPQAIGYYLNIADEKREFDRKVRTVIRGITVFFQHLEFLDFFHYGLFSYQYFCHKFLRWMVPFFLCLAFFTNLILAMKSFQFLLFFIGQIVFYAFAVWGWKRKKSISNIFLKIPIYFFVVNLSIAQAWWKYLLGQRVTLWTPSDR